MPSCCVLEGVGAIGFEPTSVCAQGRLQAVFNNLAMDNKRFYAVLQAPSVPITANSTANFFRVNASSNGTEDALPNFPVSDSPDRHSAGSMALEPLGLVLQLSNQYSAGWSRNSSSGMPCPPTSSLRLVWNHGTACQWSGYQQGRALPRHRSLFMREFRENRCPKRREAGPSQDRRTCQTKEYRIDSHCGPSPWAFHHRAKKIEAVTTR